MTDETVSEHLLIEDSTDPNKTYVSWVGHPEFSSGISYSFDVLPLYYFDEEGNFSPLLQALIDVNEPITQLSSQQQDAVNFILISTEDAENQNIDISYRVSFSDVSNITFINTTEEIDPGNIILTRATLIDSNVNGTDLGVTEPPFAIDFDTTAGDIFIDSSLPTDVSDKTSFVLLHELAHAIGLEDADIDSSTDDLKGLDSNLDSVKYTVMSNNAHPELGAGFFPSGLQLLDIAALQKLYGRNYTTRNEDNSGDIAYKAGNGFSDTNVDGFLYTIWDGGGKDTIDASDYNGPVKIDLRQGEFSSIGTDGNGNNGFSYTLDANGNIDEITKEIDNVAIAFHTVIENATGTDQGDVLIGNEWNNTLNGGGGDDFLYGSGIEYDGQTGFITPDSSDVLDPNHNIPESDDDILIGSTGNDHLYGGEGTDTLDYKQFNGNIRIIESDPIAHDGIVEKDINGDGIADETDQYFSIENFQGTKFTNILERGAVGGLTYDGSEGNDTVDYSALVTIMFHDLSNHEQMFIQDRTGSSQSSDGYGDTLKFVENVVGGSRFDTFLISDMKTNIDGGPTGGADTVLVLGHHDDFIWDQTNETLTDNLGQTIDVKNIEEIRFLEESNYDIEVNAGTNYAEFFPFSSLTTEQDKQFIYDTNNDEFVPEDTLLIQRDYFQESGNQAEITTTFEDGGPKLQELSVSSSTNTASAQTIVDFDLESGTFLLQAYGNAPLTEDGTQGDGADYFVDFHYQDYLIFTNTEFTTDPLKQSDMTISYNFEGLTDLQGSGSPFPGVRVQIEDISEGISTTEALSIGQAEAEDFTFTMDHVSPVSVYRVSFDVSVNNRVADELGFEYTKMALQVSTDLADGVIMTSGSGQFLTAPAPGSFDLSSWNPFADDTTQDNFFSGTELTDIYFADAGADVLRGNGGDDQLFGQIGIDTLYGGAGNDMLEGGAGDDFTFGGLGNDTYVFNPGDGFDLIREEGGSDTLDIGGGITFGNLVFTQIGDDLKIDIASGVTIEGQFSGDPSKVVEWVSFDDGTVVQLPNPFMQTNQPPVAVSDSYTIDEDFTFINNVLANDTDPNGDVLTAMTANFDTDHGTVTISENGDFTYTPNANFFGSDSFQYTVMDPLGLVDNATVTIDILSVNDAPVIGLDSFATNEDTGFTDNVLTNDTDVEGDPVSVVAQTVTSALGGTVEILADGTFTYTPAENANGLDSFEYIATDGIDSSVGTVSIDILPVNDNPVAQNDAFTTMEDKAVTGNVLADNGNGADTDVDGDTLEVVGGAFMTDNGGTLVLYSDGMFAYLPAENYNGTDSFEYTIIDGQGGESTALMEFNITPVNDAPVAADDSFTTDEDTVLAGELLSNDNDVDGDTIFVQAAVITTLAGATVVLNSDGTFTYSPAENVNGLDSFSYTVSDGELTDTATVTIDVTPVNDAPDAMDDAFDVGVNMVVSGNVLDNDSDVEGDALTVTAQSLTTANGGTVELNADGSFTYTPDTGFFGADSFTYDVSDGQDSSTATASFNVDFLATDVVGTSGDDRLSGSNADDRLFGLEGNDTLQGKGGNDYLNGGAGNDKLTGGNGDDVLIGGDGDDQLIGSGGMDMFYGGAGSDTMFGGGDKDTFFYDSETAFDGVDTIKNFTTRHGDVVDISDVLQGFDPLSDAISDFVQLTQQGRGKNVTLSVDVDGGGDNFVALAMITGGVGTDTEALVANGNIVLF